MAFIARGLKRISHTGAIGSGAGSVRSIWHYVSNDDIAAITGTGYFNAYIKEFVVGDILHVSADIDGTPAYRCYMIDSVTTNVGLLLAVATAA